MKKDNKVNKLEGKLPDSFVDEVKMSSADKLHQVLAEVSNKIGDIKKQQKEDATLNALKEQVKDLSGGYRDVRKIEELKQEYVLSMMKERGML